MSDLNKKLTSWLELSRLAFDNYSQIYEQNPIAAASSTEDILLVSRRLRDVSRQVRKHAADVRQRARVTHQGSLLTGESAVSQADL